ncbi:MAG TPA: single-stranded-DNA-specific exonuclease RecJ [Acidobacteriota bacterium]|nr:single-stranded-DNA-specific exonuclease RecJ [Acidobacteriota bacterium]
MTQWRYSLLEYSQKLAEQLVADLEIHPVIARILTVRGLADSQKARRFLHPSLEQLHDPFLMLDMDKAVERTIRALRDREKIMVHGDFDTDGLTSTAILVHTLKSMGSEVTHFIPNRLEEGYGLRNDGVDVARQRGATLLITCDCGITSVEAVDYATSLGIDTIITDHHQPEEKIPAAVAVLDPLRPGCNYPFKELAGVGVAMKLVLAVVQHCNEEPQMPSLMRMCAIGTVADVVPLIDENRVIANYGLALLPGTPNIGLRALIKIAGLDNSDITGYDVSYRLAPRINAMGRFGRQDIAMELFFTRNRSKAEDIANTMDSLNRERQRLVDRMVEQAREAIEKQPDIGMEKILVLGDERWHKGIVGIVASKLVDSYSRPALAIAIEAGLGIGSGRSIPGFHLLDALAECEDLMNRFGGHAMAAGFELPAGHIPEMRKRLEKTARSKLKDNDLQQEFAIDAEVSFSDIDEDFEEQFALLEPVGYGNPNPLMLTRGVRIALQPRSLKEKHMKLRLEKDGKFMTALAWNMAEEMAGLCEGDSIDLIYNVFFNNWRKERHLELEVKAFQKVGD